MVHRGGGLRTRRAVAIHVRGDGFASAVARFILVAALVSVPVPVHAQSHYARHGVAMFTAGHACAVCVGDAAAVASSRSWPHDALACARVSLRGNGLPCLRRASAEQHDARGEA
nr:unnamed protein product [Digitaria exilis]